MTDQIRAAAARIRDVAAKATPGPWQYGKSWIGAVAVMGPIGQPIASCGDGDGSEGEAAHIAAWSPDRALAVADLLDAIASAAEDHHAPEATCTGYTQACALAELIGGA